MPKSKSTRSADRITPQPKSHSFIAAAFIDDCGIARALTLTSARSFSKKRLDAATRLAGRQAGRELDRAMAAGDRETAKAIRSLRKQEREAERSIDRFFRRRIRTVERPSRKIAHKPPSTITSRWRYWLQALPKYDRPIRDTQNRRGVFARFRYYSSRSARPGVAKRVTAYIYRGSALDADGRPMVVTSIGETIDEAICGLDHLEQINRSAQKGAKLLNHAVLAVDHRWTPEQMIEVGRRWAEQCFGQYDLPFVVALHEPPPDGDARNWHLHVVWSWRPLERVGDHEWLAGEGLRSDLDGAAGLQLLRERFAVQMTEMSIEAHHPETYTALSYAARGLPMEPQIHLDEGRTRLARAGHFVEANEENHERVLRSEAALMDQALARSDRQLAQQQESLKSATSMLLQMPPTPAAPAIVCVPSSIAIDDQLVPAGVDELTALVNLVPPLEGVTVPATGHRPHMTGFASAGLQLRDASAEFANSRILAQYPIPSPATPQLAYAPTQLREIRSVAQPFHRAASAGNGGISASGRAGKSGSALWPQIKIETNPPFRLSSQSKPTGGRFANLRNLPVPVSVVRVDIPIVSPDGMPIMGRSPQVPALTRQPRFSVSTLAITLPLASIPPPRVAASSFVPPKVELPHHVPAQVSRAFVEPVCYHRHLQLAAPGFDIAVFVAGARKVLAQKIEAQEPSTNRDAPAPIGAPQISPALEMLLSRLEKKRRHIYESGGFLVFSPEVLESAGISPNELRSSAAQARLEVVEENQINELAEIVSYAARRPENLYRGAVGWRAHSNVADDVKTAIDAWIDEPLIQKPLGRLAVLPPIIDGDEVEFDRRKALFVSDLEELERRTAANIVWRPNDDHSGASDPSKDIVPAQQAAEVQGHDDRVPGHSNEWREIPGAEPTR